MNAIEASDARQPSRSGAVSGARRVPTTRSGRLDHGRGTSSAAWACILAVTTGLLALRLPRLEAFVETRPSPVLADLHDVGGARVAAIAVVVAHVAATASIALLVALLERWLGPTALAPTARLRIGVGGAAVAIAGIGAQASAIAMGTVPLAPSAPLLVASVGLGALVPLAFPDARGRRGHVRGACVGTVAAVLVWLL